MVEKTAAAGDACRVVLVSCPVEAADLLARALVEARQAACVNVVPGMQSVYRWRGQVESAAEALLLIKTTVAAWPRLQQAVRALHPYEVPEIIALDPVAGWPDYLHWVAECVHVD